MLEASSRLACAVAIAVCFAVFGCSFGTWLAPEDRRLRWLTAFVGTAWIATVAILVLAFARIVGWASLGSVAVGLAVGGLRLARPAAVRRSVEEDARRLVGLWRECDVVARAAVWLVLAGFGAALAAAVISPPLG